MDQIIPKNHEGKFLSIAGSSEFPLELLKKRNGILWVEYVDDSDNNEMQPKEIQENNRYLDDKSCFLITKS